MTYLDHVDELDGVHPDCEDISKFFAKIMTSPHNQHVIVRVNAKAGKGKSWLGESLSYGTACYVAEILGGQPEDYYNHSRDLGVISKSEVIRVMNTQVPYGIKFLDDVAARALNARNYRDSDNIDLNALLTTFRPLHNLVVLTAQAGFMIDKIPRNLAHYVIEMQEAIFDYGITIVKCFEIEYDEGTNRVYSHYLRASGRAYKRHVCYAPPPHVTAAYEKERAIQLERINEAKEKVASKEPRDLKKQLVPFVEDMMAEFGLTQKKACEFFGITPEYYQRIKAKQPIII